MGSLKIIKPGTLTSLQMKANNGKAFYAIPRSGPMDADSAELAQIILNNNSQDPIIECTFIAPTIRFDAQSHFCITGSEADWTLNENKIPLNIPVICKKGDLLEGKKMSTGIRSYIAVDGKINIPKTYSPFKLMRLQKGDTLEWRNKTLQFPNVDISLNNLASESVRIYKGPEFDLLNEQSLQNLISSNFSISHEISRMGAKLNGPHMKCTKDTLEYSSATFPGMIQCAPSGQLIVILNDGQTTGGYPRIAYLDDKALNAFNQRDINEEFKFDLKL